MNNTEHQMILYEAHLSNTGWTGKFAIGETAGAPGAREIIQAIRIFPKSEGGHVYYQVYYACDGWQAPVADGDIAGGVDDEKKIEGIKIWGDWEKSGQRLEYRVFTDAWSDWHPSSYGIHCAKGFQAFEARFVSVNTPVKCGSPRIGNPVIDRLNALACLRGAQSYLEIGVRSGTTFNNINCSRKTGVDPHYTFDINQYATNHAIRLFTMTSDDFFGALGRGELHFDNEPLFNLVYIDGLHKWDQVLRDFLNSMPYADDNTIWVLDDTSPCDPWSAEDSQARSYKYRQLSNVPGKPWHGDVYKTIFALHDLYPWFSYATVIDESNPQTIIWRTAKAATRQRLFMDYLPYANISYFDHLENYRIFNPVRSDKILEYIGNIFSDEPFNPEITLEDFYLLRMPANKKII